MKKKFTLTLAALLMGVTPSLPEAFAEEKSPMEESIVSQQILGNDAVTALRSSYEKGSYKEFLEEMNGSYKEVFETGALESLAALRNEGEAPWMDLAKALEMEKNRELLSMLSDKDDEMTAQKIRSSATQFSPEEEAAFTRLASFHYMLPGTGANADENTLIELDLAYEYKALHLDIPVVQGETLTDRRDKHYVLKMEQMDKMVAASKSFQDASLRDAVMTVQANLDTHLARNWDRSDLNQLANGRLIAKTDLEEKVASTLDSYRDKFRDLSQKLAESHSETKE